jgi:hypothetical protein
MDIVIENLMVFAFIITIKIRLIIFATNPNAL